MYKLILLDDTLVENDEDSTLSIIQKVRDMVKYLPNRCPYICVCVGEETEDDEELTRSNLFNAGADKVMMRPIKFTEISQVLQLFMKT